MLLVPVSAGLISLNIKDSESIHIVTNGGYLPFSWLNIKINFNFLEDNLKKQDCRGARC